MDNYGDNLAEAFAATAVEKFYEDSVTPMITNDEYEGEIKGTKSKLNVLTFTAGSLEDYTGADLTLNDVEESEGTLTTDQRKAYYFRIKSIDRFESYVKDPESTLMVEKAGQLQQAVDGYVLTLAHGDTASGNRVGTDYTTGTVAVAVTTGVVTGTGTTFASGMVGLGFKATGHSVWYRIKTYTSATSITIEDDSDDNTSAYTGGAISAGASYTIEANTARAITSSNAYSSLLDLKQKLDSRRIPKDRNRWVVVNSYYMNKLLQAGVVTRDTEADTDKIANGFVTRIAGFNLYENEELDGDNTNGYWAVAGHRSAITFAMAFVETGLEDLKGNFGKAYKGLNVYGAKVVDERRKALAALKFTA